MSEDDIVDIAERIANFGWSDYDNLEENKKAIQGLLDLYYKQQKEVEELRDKIREIIGKYIDVQEHFKYANKELYGKELRNMIKELLEV